MLDERAPGVFHAVGETVRWGTELIQIEFRLAKAELAEKATRAGAGLSLVMVGGVLATAALFLLLQAIVLGLIQAGLSPMAATLLVAAATIAIGLAFVVTGRKQLSAEALVPDRTLNDIKRDSALVKEKLT
jgi:Putative Actinobacterial Holin-X, holin superfamily III